MISPRAVTRPSRVSSDTGRMSRWVRPRRERRRAALQYPQDSRPDRSLDMALPDVAIARSAASSPSLACRLCGSPGLRSFLDLGASPPCQLFLTSDELGEPEVTYPLHVRVCESCLLTQLPPLITPEANFTEYAYYSS